MLAEPLLDPARSLFHPLQAARMVVERRLHAIDLGVKPPQQRQRVISGFLSHDWRISERPSRCSLRLTRQSISTLSVEMLCSSRPKAGSPTMPEPFQVILRRLWRRPVKCARLVSHIPGLGLASQCRLRHPAARHRKLVRPGTRPPTGGDRARPLVFYCESPVLDVLERRTPCYPRARLHRRPLVLRRCRQVGAPRAWPWRLPPPRSHPSTADPARPKRPPPVTGRRCSGCGCSGRATEPSAHSGLRTKGSTSL